MKKYLLTVVLLLAMASVAPADTLDFSITKVFPRVFAPATSSGSDRVRFYLDNPNGNEIAIRIFDITGAQVRRTLERESETVMFWDGRDQNGVVVSSGVYIYQVEADSKILSGTVVVSR